MISQPDIIHVRNSQDGFCFLVFLHLHFMNNIITLCIGKTYMVIQNGFSEPTDLTEAGNRLQIRKSRGR